MQSLYLLNGLLMALNLVASLIMLALQGMALRRWKQVEFRLLCLSTGMSLLAQLMAAAPSLGLAGGDPVVWVSWATLVPVAHCLVFGIWGTWALLRAYGRLREDNARLSAQVRAAMDAGFG